MLVQVICATSPKLKKTEGKSEMHSCKELADAERKGYERGRQEKDIQFAREAQEWRAKYYRLKASVKRALDDGND